MLQFEWDDRKARTNKKKHGISFEEAKSVFYDANAKIGADPDHSEDEDRFLIVGFSQLTRVLVVCFCELTEDSIRIISARKATKKERTDFSKPE